MKKIVFACVLLVMLFSFVPARAMETNTYSGVASKNSEFVVSFTTLRDGDITAVATFAPRDAIYMLYVRNAAGAVYGPYCEKGVDDRWGRNNVGTLTCTVPDAPAGNYIASWHPVPGKGSVVLNITAETNP